VVRLSDNLPLNSYDKIFNTLSNNLFCFSVCPANRYQKGNIGHA
jgi:hypothetical protein